MYPAILADTLRAVLQHRSDCARIMSGLTSDEVHSGLVTVAHIARDASATWVREVASEAHAFGLGFLYGRMHHR